MSWLNKANVWLTRSLRAGAAAPQADERAAHRGRVPCDTDITIRHIFSLTNPGIVKPLGDGMPPVLDDRLTVEVAERVLTHFHENRPEPASFPALATHVINVADQPETDLVQLSHLIEQDAAIAAKVLQVANSALYHRQFEIGTMKAAIAHLGMFAVANIAVGVACRSLYDSATRGEFDLYPRLWKDLFLHSMTVAYAASQFCSERRIGRPDQVFLGGMFHDIGKVISLRSLTALLAAKNLPQLDESHVERVLERTHVIVGSEAHTAWQLPPFLSTICRRHHDEDVVPTPDYDELHVIRVISGLNSLRLSMSFDRTLSRQVRQSVHALSFTQPQLRALTSSIRRAEERVAELFSITS